MGMNNNPYSGGHQDFSTRMKNIEDEDEREDSRSALSSDDVKSTANALQANRQKSAASSGGGSSAASVAGGAMMASGNPYTMAAGATLKVISAAADRRRKERQAAADGENARRSKLITALGNLGSGVGSTGMA